MLKAFLLKWIGSISYGKYFSEILAFIGNLKWVITVVVLVILFRQEIAKLIREDLPVLLQRITAIKKGNFSVELKTAEMSTDKKMLILFGAPQGIEAFVKLAQILSKYQFYWSAWNTTPEFSHAVRFSDRYSGSQVRFIDEYVKELDEFVKEYRDKYPQGVEESLKNLMVYLKEVYRYQVDKEQLSAPVFSVLKYSELIRSVDNAMTSIIKSTNNPSDTMSRSGLNP